MCRSFALLFITAPQRRQKQIKPQLSLLPPPVPDIAHMAHAADHGGAAKPAWSSSGAARPAFSPLNHPLLFNQPMGPDKRWKWPRQSKNDKKLEKKWYRRERPPDEARPRSAYCCLSERVAAFAAIRFKRLEDEEPDHMDLRPLRFRWAMLGGRGWMRVNFDDGFTTFEATCAGSVC